MKARRYYVPAQRPALNKGLHPWPRWLIRIGHFRGRENRDALPGRRLPTLNGFACDANPTPLGLALPFELG